MIINPSDGSIEVCGFKVLPGADLKTVEQGLEGKAHRVIQYGPYVTLNVRNAQIGEHEASVNLNFQDQTLRSVDLCLRHGPAGTWEDFDRKAEAQLKEEHDALLRASLGDRWTREWGNVVSRLDRDGAAQVFVEYRGWT